MEMDGAVLLNNDQCVYHSSNFVLAETGSWIVDFYIHKYTPNTNSADDEDAFDEF